MEEQASEKSVFHSAVVFASLRLLANSKSSEFDGEFVGDTRRAFDLLLLLPLSSLNLSLPSPSLVAQLLTSHL